MNRNYRLNPFVTVFTKGKNSVLYHNLTLKTVMMQRKEFTKLLNCPASKNDLKDLEKNNFIVPLDFDYIDYFNEFRKKILAKPKLSVAYFLLTNKCNYSCNYCFIETRIKKFKEKAMMKKTVKKAIDLIAKNTERVKLIFYGGEPLICRNVLEFAVEYAEKKFKELSLSMVTNASLIDEDSAKFIKAHKISVGVSLDGPKQINDAMRVDSEGFGTYEKTIKGIKLLKKMNVNFGLSVTIGPHNSQKIDGVIKEIKKLGVKGIGFNLLSPNDGVYCNASEIVSSVISGEELLRKAGIKDDRVFNRKIKPFLEEKFWLKDCAAYGHQIVITPDGKIGVCHGLWPDMQNAGFKGDYFPISVDFKGDLFEVPLFKEWSSRNALNMPQCILCHGIALCGGGCAKNALIKNGSIWGIDETNCELAKKCVEKMVWDYFGGKLRHSGLND